MPAPPDPMTRTSVSTCMGAAVMAEPIHRSARGGNSGASRSARQLGGRAVHAADLPERGLHNVDFSQSVLSPRPAELCGMDRLQRIDRLDRLGLYVPGEE